MSHFNVASTIDRWNLEDDCGNKNRYITINRTENYLSELRWKLGLNTNPCTQLRKGRRCVYCGFRNYKNPIPPTDVGVLFSQILKEKDLTDIRRLELYVSGSFFDDNEVSPQARIEIMRELNRTSVKEVILESRPEFITAKNLESLGRVMNPRRITIAIGVETLNDKLRESLAKGFSTADVITSIHTIGKANMNFQAYLLLNPPTINNDRKAIRDIIDSACQILHFTRHKVTNVILAVQPFFLAKNSVVALDPAFSQYVRPPWLYTTAITLKMLSIMTSQIKRNFHIVLGNENDNVDALLTSSNYTTSGEACSCTDTVKRMLFDVNSSQEKFDQGVREVLNSSCRCKDLWQKEIGITKTELIDIMAERE